MDLPANPRIAVSLDGAWEFRFGEAARWRTVTVPGPWQAQCPDLRNSFGTGHYRRRITVPDGPGVAMLRFGAASDSALVRLDGVEIGRHEGGYLPFEIELPRGATGARMLEVDCTLPSPDLAVFPQGSFAEIPHGKQSWYGPLGGLWQSVTLERRPLCHIAAVRIDPVPATGQVDVAVRLAAGPGGGTVQAAIVAADGTGVADGTAQPGDARPTLRLTVPQPALWCPDAPYLYTLRLTLVVDGQVVDAVSETFGFRTIEAREGRLLLNGAPFYLRGALDQDYYPDGICTPPSTAFLEDQFRKAKALGLNCLRCHIKVPDPRYYEVADRLGMLVWTEIPNVAQLTPAAAQRLRTTFEGIVARDGHHPSIIAWTLINEDWGTRLTEDASHRAWLADTYAWAKALDPTRLVVDNSACLPNFHVRTDIDDFHYYRGLPERRTEWDQLTAEFANRASWTFSPHGDAVRTGQEPLMVSEFGVWGLPHPDALREPDGAEPWWMEAGAFWGDGAAYPHGMAMRYGLLNLNRVFGSFDAFVAAVQWHQFAGLKYQIESIRSHAAITGYVITELTDVHWEANGLLDLRRNPRVFHDRFGTINAETVLLPSVERWAYWAGESVTVQVTVAAGGNGYASGGTLAWRFGDEAGEAPMEGVAPMTTSAPVPVVLAAPEGAGSRCGEVALSFTAADGTPVASNRLALAIITRPAPAGLTVAAADPALAAYLGALGLAVTEEAAADVVVTRCVDAADVEAIRLGRRVLVLADGHDGHRATLRTDLPPREPPFVPILDATPGLPAAPHHQFPGLGWATRHGTLWRGDWIGNFSWLRREGAFARLPGGPMLDLSFDRVVPHHVLTGFQPWEWEGRVHAGVVVGWVHKPAVLIGERPFGAGKLVATTFRLTEDAPGQDPVAATLLHALIETTAA